MLSWNNKNGNGRQAPRIFIQVFIDALILVTAYLVTFAVRTSSTPLELLDSAAFIAFAVMVMLASLYGFGVYRRIWERTSGHGIVVIINAVIVATTIIFFADLLFRPRALPLSVVLVGGVLAMGGFIILRYRSRLVSGIFWRWRAIWHLEFPDAAKQIRVLIVGAGEPGQQLAMRLKYHSPNSQYRVLGFVDGDAAKHGMYVEGSPVLGAYEDIPQLGRAQNIDLIVLAIHDLSGPEFRKILSYCEATAARIKVVPDLFELVGGRQNGKLLRDIRPEDLIGRQALKAFDLADRSFIEGKSVLVTGAAGSIGSELARQLSLLDPDCLLLLDNNESGLHDLVTELRARFPDASLFPLLADITGRERIETLLDSYRPGVIFHAAAYKHVPMLESYPAEALRVNIGGTYHLARLAQQYHVERFVFISTDKAVDPISVMGASKRLGELLLQALARPDAGQTLFASVRFGNVLGSRGSVVPTFDNQIENGGPVTVTSEEMTRYFMSISEAVNLVIHAASMTGGNDVFLLQMGEVVSILKLAERMIRLHGLRPYEDIAIEITGVRPGEKLHEELLDRFEQALETAHPNIIKLARNGGPLHKTDLLNRVETLLAAGFDDLTTPLSQLRALIEQTAELTSGPTR